MLLDGVKDVLRRKPLRLKKRWAEIDHDLALLSTVGVRNNRAGNGDELRTEEILAEVVQLLLGESLAGEAELENRDARGAVVNDEGRKGARWQLTKNRLRDCGDLRVGIFQAGVGLEKDFDDGLAVDGGGFNVFDVIDGGGENAFVNGGYAAFEFFRVEAGVLPGDGDNGDINVGEDVRGSAEDDDGAH